MLLQTFVQLNILLLTAPALAGWVTVPAGHPLLTQAVCASFLPSAQVSEEHPVPQAQQAAQRALGRPFTIAERLPSASARSFTRDFAPPLVTRFYPFSQSARAP
jgi:hypothetical protein